MHVKSIPVVARDGVKLYAEERGAGVPGSAGRTLDAEEILFSSPSRDGIIRSQ
jgi:hypothetical protein